MIKKKKKKRKQEGKWGYRDLLTCAKALPRGGVYNYVTNARSSSQLLP